MHAHINHMFMSNNHVGQLFVVDCIYKLSLYRMRHNILTMSHQRIFTFMHTCAFIIGSRP